MPASPRPPSCALASDAARDDRARARSQVRAEIEAQLPKRQSDVAALEAELHAVTFEQKRLAKAVARSDEIPELVAELKQRMNRMKNPGAQIAAARRTPAGLAAMIDRVEASIRDRLSDIRSTLDDLRDLREILMGLFPKGLVFSPHARRTANARSRK